MNHDNGSYDPTQWFPMPAVLVACRGPDGMANIMGIGYVGFVCWSPPTVFLGMNTGRYSGTVIRETREFVIALPAPKDVEKLDYCGFVSGADLDKFSAVGYTRGEAKFVNVPIIRECPVNLECRLENIVQIGSHDGFLGRVLHTHVDAEYVGAELRFNPIILMSRQYRVASEFLCDFGASGGVPPVLETDRADH